MGLLETYRPEWRTKQVDVACTQILPADVRHPLMLHLSCYAHQPGVIVP